MLPRRRIGQRPGRTAFPIIELIIVCCLWVWIAVGVTLGLLDAPGRTWPWFSVGLACAAAIAVAGILESARATFVVTVLVGAPLVFAGFGLQALGYDWLAWLAFGVAALAALIGLVRAAAALFRRRP